MIKSSVVKDKFGSIQHIKNLYQSCRKIKIEISLYIKQFVETILYINFIQ